MDTASVTTVLRGSESNRRLEVMGLPRYLSSTPRYKYIIPDLMRSATSQYLKLLEDSRIARDSAAHERFREIKSRALVCDLITHLMRLPCIL